MARMTYKSLPESEADKMRWSEEDPTMTKSKATSLLRNQLNACIVVLQRLDTIRNTSGHGKIELVVSKGRVVQSDTTVRDHLPTETE